MGMFDDLIPQGGAQAPAESATGPRGIGQPEELNFGERLLSGVTLPAWMDDLRGSTPFRLAKGMANPVVGTVQKVANMLPESTGAGASVNRRIDEVQRQTDAETKARGNETGGAVAEFAGEVLSPVNALILAKVPMAATAGMRTLQGIGIGGGTAAMQPVYGASEGKANVGTETLKQFGGGALAGGILNPLLGKLADRAVRHLAKPNPAVLEATGALDVDGAIAKALDDAGQTAADLPADALAALRKEVTNLAISGKKLDAAAALRKADFDALGMEGTLGQITRDPTLYAREKNLQSIPGVGDELTRRFNLQNRDLIERIAKPARGAKAADEAGDALIASLKGTDETLGRHVSGLYREAREAGYATEIPLAGLAQDYADILGRYSEKVQQSLPRQVFEALGLGSGTQKKIFGYDDAEKLLQTLNANRSSDPAVNSAIGELRGAVKRAITEAAGGPGPYDAARKAASGRFSLQDAVPALKAAAEGSVAPDDFVRRFVIGGKRDEVRGMADILKQTDPPAWQEARAQIADHLKRAAFGENPAGDAPFRSQAYMKAIRDLGPNKLGAFFNPKELQDIMRVGRVGAYMRSFPADSPVNTSRSAGVGAWMLSKMGTAGRAVADLGNAAADTVKRSSDARRSLAAAVPVTEAELTPGQVNLLARILGIGAVAGGTIAGSAAGR